jgi:hypothetical protein
MSASPSARKSFLSISGKHRVINQCVLSPKGAS